MAEHPCIGCINNWSGDQIPCSDFCEEFSVWKKQQKLLNSLQPKVPSILEAFWH